MTPAPTKTVHLRSVVFDCADPIALANFYGALLGADIDLSDPDWCEVQFSNAPKLAFQRVANFTAPVWPDGQPQQIHLDLTVTDLKSASLKAIDLGARLLGEPVDEGIYSTFQVHADPAGHPFCLCEDHVITDSPPAPAEK
jgi:predicted enzyme related to lactoylglutathione lyase